jgi:exopolysaccharide production protein ExoQ
MASRIAALICILFILYLFRTDLKKDHGFSNALWLPLFWMFLAGSRYVSSWLSLSSPQNLIEAASEGSPIDAVAFFLLTAAGLVVLYRRKIDWGRLLNHNRWIWLYFLYCGISIIWSDVPFISLKRWIKELGNPTMVLVILTEKNPYEAVGLILRRLSFLALPLSVLFIRYYPGLGRAYHHDGSPMYTGVGHQKNDLGLLCLIYAIYFSWNFLLTRKGDFKVGRLGDITDIVLLGMAAYLLRMAQSATSLLCSVVAVTLFFTSRMSLFAKKPSRLIIFMMMSASILLVLEATLGVKDLVFEMLGRDATLTSRVSIWQALREIDTNPFVGVGFMSFWAGDRLEIIFRIIGTEGVQAHNGYLEQYLNLGYIGVVSIGTIILSGLLKVRRHLTVDYRSAMLRLCFIVTAVLYNWTEASFYGINNMWLLLLLGTFEIPDQQEPKATDSGDRDQQGG